MRLTVPRLPAYCTRSYTAVSRWRQMALCALAVLLALAGAGVSISPRSLRAGSQPISPLVPRSVTFAGAASHIFLPFVTFDATVVAASCDLNPDEQALLQLMQSDPRQQRAALVCNPILARVARAKAEDMATRDYFHHINPDGEGPNYLVRAAGFPLPSWYNRAKQANNLESLAGGYATPADTWHGWMHSSSHEKHLLGLNAFYADQTEVGVGYMAKTGSRYTHYWVVLTAPPPEPAAQ